MNKKSKPRVVAWDFDGVICTPSPDRLDKYLKSTGKKTDWLDKFFQEGYRKCLTGEVDTKTVLAPYLEGSDWDSGVDGLIDLWHSHGDHQDETLLEVLATLRSNGTSVVLATNQELCRAYYMIQKMKVCRNFDKSYFSCYMGAAKPNLPYYRQIEADQKVSSEDIVFFDDSPKNIAGAKDAGWNAHLYEGVESAKKILADYGLW